MAQIGHAGFFDQCFQDFRLNTRQPTDGVFGLRLLTLAVAEEAAFVGLATTPSGTRQRKDFEIHGTIFAARTADDFRRMEEIGITEAAHIPWGAYSGIDDPAAQIDAIKRFGDEIIAKCS